MIRTFLYTVSLKSTFRSAQGNAYIVIDVSEHLLRCEDQLRHLPYCLLSLVSPVKSQETMRVVLTVSKSMDVNLNSRRKKGGIRIVLRRCVDMASTNS